METNGLLRQQIIKSLMAQYPEKCADAAINLWESMSIRIISIVGERGFNSIYARSIFLTQQTFTWLTVSSLSPQTDQRFAELKTSLEKQAPAQANEANHLLLMTFTDILATLIGEKLTINILRSAWGNDVSDRADKGFENE